MSLVKNCFVFTEERPTQKVFEESKRRIKEKEQQIDDLHNELCLLKHQILDIYRKSVFYTIPVNGDVIKSARAWLRMLNDGVDSEGKKLNKRKKYDEKVTYEALNEHLSDVLGIDIEISRIFDYNYGEATIFEFYYEGYNWSLEVPIVHAINMKSFDYYGENCFKLRLSYYESEYCSRCMGTTFEEKDLKDIMQKILKELKSKEEKNETKINPGDTT